MNRDARLKDPEISLDNDALEELHVPPLVLGEREDRGAGCGEEILKMLFAAMQEFEPGFVSQGGLGTARLSSSRNMDATEAHRHLLSDFSTLALLLVLRVDGLLFLLD